MVLKNREHVTPSCPCSLLLFLAWLPLACDWLVYFNKQNLGLDDCGSITQHEVICYLFVGHIIFKRLKFSDSARVGYLLLSEDLEFQSLDRC